MLAQESQATETLMISQDGPLSLGGICKAKPTSSSIPRSELCLSRAPDKSVENMKDGRLQNTNTIIKPCHASQQSGHKSLQSTLCQSCLSTPHFYPCLVPRFPLIQFLTASHFSSCHLARKNMFTLFMILKN